MQNEIAKKPMVDILSDMTGEQVVMDGEKYIALKDGADIGDDFVADAVVKQEELYQEAFLERSKEEAIYYLKTTDWVEPYLIKHYTGIELLPEQSNKFEIERKRKEAKALLQSINSTPKQGVESDKAGIQTTNVLTI